MYKTLKLALNKYPTIPESLQDEQASAVPRVDVDLARLFHHYFLDTHGVAPPNPDPSRFEHLQFLLPCRDFRVAGDGFATKSAARPSRSNEFGQALCRWFLSEHLDITYFAHMGELLGRRATHAQGGFTVEKVQSGDTPDYLCARNVTDVYLAEAKGRTSSISFASKAFQQWRDQFKRVVVKDANGRERPVKGHIVATRFATEVDNKSVQSTIYAEDPVSRGEGSPGELPELGQRILALHYAGIATKLRQPLVAAALRSGVPVPNEIRFPSIVWQFLLPGLEKLSFIGGYFPGEGGAVPFELNGGRMLMRSGDPLRLDIATGTFFGIEKQIFRSICSMARQGDVEALRVPRLTPIAPFYSGISLLRDGSIVGPIEFFSPVEQIVF